MTLFWDDAYLPQLPVIDAQAVLVEDTVARAEALRA